jgi:hypothetical protein
VEVAGISGIKRKDILWTKINELAMNSNNKNIKRPVKRNK